MGNLDFLLDLRRMAAQKLTELGHPPQPSDDLDTVLTNYLNLRRRLVPVVSWKIELSTEVKNKTLPTKVQQGLTEFTKKAQDGEDLKPYLSTRITNPAYRDLMFYDWGIYHFHLGTELQTNGFIKRTNELLFALADPSSTTMYLIDIHLHKDSFTNQNLLRILEENWPEIVDQYAFKDIAELDHNPSNEDIGKFRKAGINAMVRTPAGRVLPPMGGGITSAGTSLEIKRDILKIRKIVQKVQDEILKNRDLIEDRFRNQYNKNWDDLDIKMTALGTNVEVREMTTGEVVNQTKLA